MLVTVKLEGDVETRVCFKQSHVLQVKGGDEGVRDLKIGLVGARGLNGGDTKAVGVDDVDSARGGKRTRPSDLLPQELFQRVHCFYYY